MTYFHPAWVEHQRRHWMRPDAERYIRPDARHFMPPGTPRWSGKDAVRYFWPEHKTYGTAVHKKVEVEVNGPTTTPRSEPRDPNFRAEVSLIKSTAARSGAPDSRRVDVLENPGKGTVCVYDIKTGLSPLSLARMRELASTVSFFCPGTQRIIVTEVRPRR